MKDFMKLMRQYASPYKGHLVGAVALNIFSDGLPQYLDQAQTALPSFRKYEKKYLKKRKILFPTHLPKKTAFSKLLLKQLRKIKKMKTRIPSL